jgi:uncharacterized protein YhbP (UPF0306 family)
MSVGLPDEIHQLLQISTLSLATSGPGGEPHAAPVYFAALYEPLRLFFFSDPDSLHGQHLAQSDRAAAAIYPECAGWQDIRGLQLHGLAERVAGGPEWEAGWAAYTAKFPFVTALKPIIARNALYRLQPTWLRLVDNRRRFGFKQEWHLT